MKQKAFFIIFKDLSVIKNCLRPKSTALKALGDGQGKIKMYYGESKVKRQVLGKKSIETTDQF